MIDTAFLIYEPNHLTHEVLRVNPNHNTHTSIVNSETEWMATAEVELKLLIFVHISYCFLYISITKKFDSFTLKFRLIIRWHPNYCNDSISLCVHRFSQKNLWNKADQIGPLVNQISIYWFWPNDKFLLISLWWSFGQRLEGYAKNPFTLEIIGVILPLWIICRNVGNPYKSVVTNLSWSTMRIEDAVPNNWISVEIRDPKFRRSSL